jgi:C4-dicarboxylate-specific signal transduction histidine kinase
MRNFVRPGPGQSAVEELNDLTREVLELCRPELRRADVELSLELPAAVTPVYVDALQIQQVLVNLIQNAIQAMRDGAADQRRLRLRTSLEGDEVQLEVADTGPGFGCEAEQDPFAPFFTTRPEGLGMGLAISRAIIEQHQGRIWAERSSARGATVCFRLPLCHTAKRSHESPADCVCR